MQDTPTVNFPPLMPNVVLGIAAHPDDLDFGAAATMAKFAAMGADVHYLILTDGSKGSDDRSVTTQQLIEIRQKEQRAAVKAIHGKSVEFLNYPDGELVITLDLKKDIVSVIRRLRPDVVITMDPSVIYSETRGMINHPDHRAAGQAALDAVFPLARDHLAFPDLDAGGLAPHKVKTVLLTNFNRQNFFMDVSDTLELKWQALKSHASQIQDVQTIKKRFTAMAAANGQVIGCRYAEGFIRLDLH